MLFVYVLGYLLSKVRNLLCGRGQSIGVQVTRRGWNSREGIGNL
jgi:hypothetical protein